MVDIGAVRLRLNEVSQLFIGLLERSCPDIRSVDAALRRRIAYVTVANGQTVATARFNN